jgi:hypothetical protein
MPRHTSPRRAPPRDACRAQAAAWGVFLWDTGTLTTKYLRHNVFITDPLWDTDRDTDTDRDSESLSRLFDRDTDTGH